MKLQLTILLITFIHQTISQTTGLKIQITNLKGNRYNISCFYEENSNSYNTNVKSISSPGLLIPADSNDGNVRPNHQLHFNLLNKTHASRGRCRTRPPSTLQGDVNGIIMARIFINSTVAKSLGVFTIAILETPYSKKTELDLFVVNLLDSSKKAVVKSGLPGKAGSIDLDKVSNKWITFKMTKNQNNCETVITEVETNVELGRFSGLYCKIGMNNTIVVNARSRDYDSKKLSSSMITIDSISWKRLP